MTTTVKIEAHCREGIEVVIEVTNDPANYNGQTVVQNGETWQGVVYDAKTITVSERPKS